MIRLFIGKRGFTLIEAMIALAILSISLLGVVAMMVYFGTDTSDKNLKSCLLDRATSALSQYRANALPVPTSFTCTNRTGTMTMSHTTFPGPNLCNDVTATASAGGKTIQLSTKVCNMQ
jgi:prepilin-type N-terminal cleavage/methylation domain-containing protein